MKEVNGIKDIDFAFILEYVKEQGPDAIQWLKDLKNKPVKPDKQRVCYQVFSQVGPQEKGEKADHVGADRRSLRLSGAAGLIDPLRPLLNLTTERTGKAYPRPPLCSTRRAEPLALCSAGGAEPRPARPLRRRWSGAGAAKHRRRPQAAAGSAGGG